MTSPNADQIAEWNGALGERWAQYRDQTERFLQPFGDAILETAGARRGERVVDIGCGAGDTSLPLAEQVGVSGAVVGVDVSKPLLSIARERAEAQGLSHLRFIEADASELRLPTPSSLLVSRFGVMFFGDPAAAFANMRGLLARDGRLAFICWRHPRDNPWAMAPLVAARQALGVSPPPADLNAPGPFAFWDAARIEQILTDAGFTGIHIRPFDARLHVGDTPRDAAESSARIGPLSRLIRDTGAERLPEILDAVETALTPHRAPDGRVLLGGGCWIVTAAASV